MSFAGRHVVCGPRYTVQNVVFRSFVKFVAKLERIREMKEDDAGGALAGTPGAIRTY